MLVCLYLTTINIKKEARKPTVLYKYQTEPLIAFRRELVAHLSSKVKELNKINANALVA